MMMKKKTVMGASSAKFRCNGTATKIILNGWMSATLLVQWRGKAEGNGADDNFVCRKQRVTSQMRETPATQWTVLLVLLLLPSQILHLSQLLYQCTYTISRQLLKLLILFHPATKRMLLILWHHTGRILHPAWLRHPLSSTQKILGLPIFVPVMTEMTEKLRHDRLNDHRQHPHLQSKPLYEEERCPFCRMETETGLYWRR